MVLRLLLNFSVASMNKLSMGVFWERRSFTCRGREGGEAHCPCVSSGRHPSGRHLVPPQALPWLPGACRIKSGPSGQPWSLWSLEPRFTLSTLEAGSLTGVPLTPLSCDN